MKLENTKLENGDIQIIITLDSHDQICLKHDLLDIVDWFYKGPCQEKVSNCRSRMIKDCKDMLLSSPDMQNKNLSEINALLSDQIALVEAISKLPDYKNRAQRES